MEDDTLAAADELKALGVPVHAIGLGDPGRAGLAYPGDGSRRPAHLISSTRASQCV